MLLGMQQTLEAKTGALRPIRSRVREIRGSNIAGQLYFLKG